MLALSAIPAALRTALLAALVAAILGLGVYAWAQHGAAVQARTALAAYQAQVAAETARLALAAAERERQAGEVQLTAASTDRLSAAATTARIDQEIDDAARLPPPPAAPGTAAPAVCGPIGLRPAVAAALRGLRLDPAAAGGDGAAGPRP